MLKRKKKCEFLTWILLAIFVGVMTSSISFADPRGKIFNVKDYNAVADGKTLDTAAFAAAIEACFQNAGGTVLVPAGEYFTGQIVLKSNVTFRMKRGTVIRFTDDFSAYPIDQVRHEGIEMEGISSLIHARNAHNVSIVGEGILDGSGMKWWKHFLEAQKRDPKAPVTELEKEIARLNEGKLKRSIGWFFPRPCFIEFYNCRNILLEEFTTRNSPMWTIHPVYCENIIARGLNITGAEEEPNTDGFNPDSCRNVLVENCEFATGDDCLTIKSGYNEDGRRVGVPCENIMVRNCLMHHGHGAVVIGSETSGGIRNVKVENCRFLGTDRGIRIKSARGRGAVVENVEVDGVEMKDIVQDPIHITTYYGQKGGIDAAAEPVSDATPIFRNIHIRNVRCDGAADAVTMLGLPEMPLQDISLENVQITAKKAGQCRFVQGLKLTNVQITSEDKTDIKIENCSEVIRKCQ